MTELVRRSVTDSLLEYESRLSVTLEDYEPYIGPQRVEQLKRLAAPLQGRGWVNVNSTLEGGGVAEMLTSVIPLARSLGIEAHWYAIQGHPEFFGITKKFHNLLQGVDQPISLENLLGDYLDGIEENTKGTMIASDMIEVHDPQPVAMAMAGVFYGNVLWRCHIDTSRPNPLLWRFLLPYINHYSGVIFTQPEFVGRGLQTPVYQIHPCIDPLAEKNQHYTDRKSLEVLAPLLKEHDIDPRRPILAAVSRYDIHKNQASIIKAFKRLREERSYNPPPYLIFLGNTAVDDPEGGAMLESLRAMGDDPDIRFWVNVEDNDRVVGALMQIARGFIHVSTREGFGLVVSEAMWQGTPVVGSRVGGVTKQVVDGETGYLVDPLDVDAIASRMARLLDDRHQASALGERARLHVREHFLLPELVSRYLVLLQYFTGVRKELPEFRIDSLAYSDIAHAVRPLHPKVPVPPALNGNGHGRISVCGPDCRWLAAAQSESNGNSVSVQSSEGSDPPKIA